MRESDRLVEQLAAVLEDWLRFVSHSESDGGGGKGETLLKGLFRAKITGITCEKCCQTRVCRAAPQRTNGI